MIHQIPLFVLSFLAGVTGAWLIATFGSQLSLLDQPNHRSSHLKATPKGGGIGILAAMVLLSYCLDLPFFLGLAAAVVSIVSFIGDRIDIAPLYRLLIQIMAALTVIFLYRNEPAGQNHHYLMIIPLTIFIVATANYYNFMDGINGIAAITGIVGFGLMAVFINSRDGQSPFAMLAIGLSLSCLGFIPFNLPRARVFMGDVGSILLGFMFAAMIIWISRSWLEFICLASFLFPFYVDEITTVFIRLKKGEKLWTPHRRHFYQILANEFGIDHWKISAGYGAAQLLIGLSMLWAAKAGFLPAILTIGWYFILFCLLSSMVRRRLANVA